MSNEFKKYMNKFTLAFHIPAAFCVILAVIALSNAAIPGVVVTLVIGLLLTIPFWKTKKYFDALEQNPALATFLSNDFQQATPMRKDTIRFSHTNIYMKHSAKTLQYVDIQQVYQYIHRTNFVEDERSLKYVDLSGKHHRLCRLELRDASKDEMMHIINILLSKNPHIKVGYR